MGCERAIVTAAALALGLGLAGCETSNWSDKIQDTIADMNVFGTSKKPLPGERKEVFPQGVPGVTPGVPPELLPGNQANAQPEPPAQAPVPPVPPAPKKKKVAAKKKVQREAPPPGNAPPPADGVWPPPPNSAPPPPDGVWPPPPR
jgi:hypothetical protein